MFRCPDCRAPFDGAHLARPSQCARCGLSIDNVEGVPLLIQDRRAIEAAISEARRQGLDAWYSAPQLDQWTGPYRHHVHKRKRWLENALAEHTARRGAQPATGLDLGCGDGANLHWLRHHVAQLFGSDYNLMRLLRAAKLDIGAQLFMADICNYPADDDCFDLIFFNHVLEHIPDDAAALREVRRVLKRDGLLILGVPNEGAALWQLAYRLQPKVLATSDHRHFFTAESICARCKDAGLIVEKVHHIGWGVPHWTLDALIRRFKWIDDGLEKIGRAFVPSQATSLYLLLSK